MTKPKRKTKSEVKSKVLEKMTGKEKLALVKSVQKKKSKKPASRIKVREEEREVRVKVKVRTIELTPEEVAEAVIAYIADKYPSCYQANERNSKATENVSQGMYFGHIFEMREDPK